MKKIIVAVKHKDMKEHEFYVTKVEIDKDYNIYTTIAEYANFAIVLDDKDKARNLRKLVMSDMKLKNGYTVYLKEY